MKQRLTMILMMLGLIMGFVFFGAQNIAEAEKIVVTSFRDRSNEIYAMNVVGSNQMRLSNNAAFNVKPSRANQTDTDGDGVPDFRDNCPTKPNPEKIAFVSDRGGGNPAIYVMNADGSNVTRLTNNPAGGSEPSFSPDGSKIAFLSHRDSNIGINEIYVMNADGTNQMRLTNTPANEERHPTFSPDGSKIAFTSFGTGDIYVMNTDGSNLIRLTNNPAGNSDPSFSPDGSKIAFASARDRINFDEIYVMNADGTNQVNLTNNSADDTGPAFSPDGSKIAFSSRRDGNFEIYVMNADGSNQMNLTNNPAGDRKPTFSPDGSKIAFSSFRDNSRGEIYVMNADGSNQMNLTNNPAGDTQPSCGGQADSDGDGIGDACENNRPRLGFFNFSDSPWQPIFFNEVDAGSIISVGFSLNGFKGFDVYAAPPASQRIRCFDKVTLGPLQPIQTFPPDPSYNSVFDLYITTWRTRAVWAGTCRRLVLTFDNEPTKTMDFRFR